jgi:multidrug efflux pump subunit AcrB
VRLPVGQSQPVSTLSKVYVPSQSGQIILLSQIATPVLKSVPSQIRRYRLQRYTTLTSYDEPGFLASNLNKQVIRGLEKIKFPPGYSWEAGGAAEVTARNTAGLGGVILLAVFGIFGVLVAEF